ncbi:sodium-translocating pyrophosphatase [Rosistilla oblonga]|uniref:sodium-translocating pyrophosphatase n=1 Tax=Rosistilla oblonga TaxID=2527990 RepID=UPI003A96DB74
MNAGIVWLVCFASAIAALVWARRFYTAMMEADEGTDLMREIAESVRQGADAYLKQQYRWVTIVFIVVAALLSVAAYGFGLQSGFVPIAFVTGGFFSGLCGWFGMKTATQASSRTAAAARHSLDQGLQIAFRSGAVMGLTVVGMGLIYITVWFAILYWICPMLGHPLSLQQISIAMLSFGMGASAQALFARVGGGIFTKAADVGADLVGKVESDMREDSPQNPATIADNVGDNVGDVAGMGADLYESYCGSILAASALGVAAMSNPALMPEGVSVESAQLDAMLLPMAISGVGILLSIAGIYRVRTGENTSQTQLLHALARGINFSAALVVVAAVLVSLWLMPRIPGTMLWGVLPGVAVSIIVGLGAGWLIGKWTEYATSDEEQPTRKLAEQAETGPATLIICGIADGMMSVWVPVIIVCAATLAAYGFACGGHFNNFQYFPLGLYGVGIAAVGMLSTLGITLATDAYGPIADNAGGNAEMAGLEETVRQRTDALDSLGNTTAATGKGFAIGSAALTALALLAAYVEGVRDGFDRWATAEVVQIDEDGLYKIAPSFALEKAGEEVTPFLLMPTTSLDPTSLDGWNAIDTSAGPARIDAAVVSQIENGAPLLASTQENLISTRTATIRDFMRYYDGSLMNPRVLVGMFMGAMATFLFCAMTMKAVGRAAQGMVLEVRRQLKENPGIKTGEVKPDYQRPVAISTKAAQREMVLPSLIGLLLPIAIGLVLGVAGVIGLLAGCLTSGFCLAIFMSNAGGSWDNAKKYIESGAHGGKGSEAHKAAVVGDTVGDPFKDTSGPSLNILIKLMSMVSVVVAGLVVRFSLVAMGIL